MGLDMGESRTKLPCPTQKTKQVTNTLIRKPTNDVTRAKDIMDATISGEKYLLKE
jgi:hypothetical protein